VLAQHLSQPPPPLGDRVRDLPPGLEAVVMSMLEKDPERRPADLRRVIDALSSLETGSG
jgi:serine/threonine-protein kinase